MGQIEDVAETTAIVWATVALIACALVATAVITARSRKRVGRALVSERGSWLARACAITASLALAMPLASRAGEAPIAAALVALALAAVLFAIRPSSRDAVFGETGVRRGWHARRFEELEEWRLAGEHLRWKLRGEWFACPVPVDMQADLRAKLALLCPERESQFKD